MNLFPIVLLLGIFSSEACLNVRKFNECGCFDYKTLTRSRIASMDSNLADEISEGKLTVPVYEYVDNCTYINVRCDIENTNATRKLIRTNWPYMDMVYYVTFGSSLSYTSTLWFNVECDRETHEWKYSEVDDDRQIVNEHLICHSK